MVIFEHKRIQFLSRPAAHEVPWERKSKGLHSHTVKSLGIYHTSFRCHGNTLWILYSYLQGSVFSFGTQFQLLRILESSSFVKFHLMRYIDTEICRDCQNVKTFRKIYNIMFFNSFSIIFIKGCQIIETTK
jgi:hypothetical protein